MCICVHIWAAICIYAYLRAYMRRFLHICVYACIYAHIYAQNPHTAPQIHADIALSGALGRSLVARGSRQAPSRCPREALDRPAHCQPRHTQYTRGAQPQWGLSPGPAAIGELTISIAGHTAPARRKGPIHRRRCLRWCSAKWLLLLLEHA